VRGVVLAVRVWLAVVLAVAGLVLATRERHVNFPYLCICMAVTAMPWDAVCGRPHVDDEEGACE